MEIWEAIARRRSVRHYSSAPIAPDAIQRILEAAVSAPSAGNLQPWHFRVVGNAAIKNSLCRAAWNQQFVAQAPVIIVVCAEADRSAATYGSRGRDLYCLQDTAAAAMSILLTATALGLGSCWVGAFDEERASQALGLPPELRPVAIIALGYAADSGLTRSKRLPLSEVCSFFY